MTPRVFLSFDFDHDAKFKLYFAGQGVKDSPTPYTISDWSSKTALPQAQWEALIASKIAHCHMLIVLVGNHMSSATGVAKEIQFAKDANVPCFGVYIDGAVSSSSLPNGISRNNVVGWKWPEIASMIDKAMSLGKNK
jgi:hypothetical protein